jgi:hypothetical protein
MRNYFLLLGLFVAGVSPLSADDGDPHAAGPIIERFRCRFEDSNDRKRGESFTFHESTPGPVFDVRFAGTYGDATLTRHETLWPEQFELRVSGRVRGFIMVGLDTDTGLTFTEVIEAEKHITYYDTKGRWLPGPRDSAYRIEVVRQGNVAQLLITTSPAARSNNKWKVNWYAAGW